MAGLEDPGRQLDIKGLRGSEPWQRLRIGDYRVIFRQVDFDEPGAAGATVLVARVVHRRDLERAVYTLE